jgi:hypothetical protein
MSKSYEDPESGRKMSPKALQGEEPEIQKMIMKHWFDEHFDDPETMPGTRLVKTHDALCSEFAGILDKELIRECAAEIEDESLGCDQWSPRLE